MAEVTFQELDKYSSMRYELMKEFIETSGSWVNWAELSGFEATMAKMAIAKIIRNAYAAGAEFGMQTMMHNMKHDEDFGYDPSGKV